MKRIKLVLLSSSELTPRFQDYYCLDELVPMFDIEYWDCSDVLKPFIKVDNKDNRQYVIKITSLKDFKHNLNRIPRDTVISYHGLFNKENYKFLKILHSKFRKINVVEFNLNLPVNFVFADGNPKELLNNLPQRILPHQFLFRFIKKIINRNDYLQYKITSILHPERQGELEMQYFRKKARSLFEYYQFSPAVDAKYYINTPDVDKFMRCKKNMPISEDRYIVYLDQYFPFHSVVKAYAPDIDIQPLIEPHFRKMNNFFDKVEQKYGCRVIIAAHPQAQYAADTFNQREIQYFNTERLVAGCVAAFTHYSCSISYAALNDKPIALLLDDEIKKSSVFYDSLVNLNRKYGIQVIDIEDAEKIPEIIKIPSDGRTDYMTETFGGLNLQDYHSNVEWFTKHFTTIYHEMYD